MSQEQIPAEAACCKRNRRLDREQLLVDWRGSINEPMTQGLLAFLNDADPITAEPIERLNWRVLVVNSHELLDCQVRRPVCECGEPLVTVALSATYLLYLWRTVTLASTLMTEFEVGPDRIRGAFRDVDANDVEEYAKLIHSYYGLRDIREETFDYLLQRLQAAPPAVRGLSQEIARLAELFALHHELAHAFRDLSGKGVVEPAIDAFSPDWQLSKHREAAWRREFLADLDGASRLAIGFTESVSRRKPPPAGEAKQSGVPYVFGAVSVALGAIWTLESYRGVDRRAAQFATAQEFSGHPPAILRIDGFNRWGSEFARGNGVTDPWWLANLYQDAVGRIIEAFHLAHPGVFGERK